MFGKSRPTSNQELAKQKKEVDDTVSEINDMANDIYAGLDDIQQFVDGTRKGNKPNPATLLAPKKSVQTNSNDSSPAKDSKKSNSL